MMLTTHFHLAQGLRIGVAVQRICLDGVFRDIFLPFTVPTVSIDNHTIDTFSYYSSSATQLLAFH